MLPEAPAFVPGVDDLAVAGEAVEQAQCGVKRDVAAACMTPVEAISEARCGNRTRNRLQARGNGRLEGRVGRSIEVGFTAVGAYGCGGLLEARQNFD